MTISLHHSILLDITINFLVGILRLFKPKIKISDKICYKNDENGNKFYFFKIVNNSIYNTYSIKIELYKKTPYIVNKTKINYRIQEIKISSNNYYFIPRYKKQKGYGDHAVLSRTFEDLSKEIDTENVEYVLYVSAKHGLSNLTSVTTMSFESSKVFHKGNFKFGSNIRTL